MIWFDKKRIPPGNWPFLNTVRAGLAEIELSLEPEIDLTEGNEEVLITGCMRAYRQAVLRRVLDLSQSAVVSWNAGLSIGAIVCSRSLLETIAMFHSFFKQAEVLAAAKEWENIGSLLDLYAFSTSSGPRKERTGNALPRITDIVREFINAAEPGKSHFWDQICDTAHPNGKRMLNHAGVLSNKRYIAKATADDEPERFIAVFNALYSICWLITAEDDFNILLEVIRSGGELPADHHLIVARTNLDAVSSEIEKKIGKIDFGPPGKKRKK